MINPSARLVSSENSLFGLQMAVFSLCSYKVFPLCMVYVLISSSYKNTSHCVIGPILVVSF